jgi:translation initiation factor eIF-2B subunit beta
MTGFTDETEIRSYLDVRRWLEEHHRKHLALLDRFLLELRRGRLAQCKPASTKDRRIMIHRTVDFLRHMVGSTKWKNPAQLHLLLRGIGHELQTAGHHEPSIGNVVRRIMAAVREEANFENEHTSVGDTGRLSLQSMLWALPQHVKASNRSISVMSGDHQRQESFADADVVSQEYPAFYYQERSGLKSTVMEASKYHSLQEIALTCSSFGNTHPLRYRFL